MKLTFRLAAIVLTAAAVLISTPGCERRPASTAKMFVDEAYSKTNAAAKEHGDKKGHGDKKKDAHPPADAAATPQKFIPGK
ncbi:MAG: hypothetical protein JSR82_07370 [Verrucomicrobia bacterium]|nr:hypothetical protein [Verrucomicrobiota bacterium]